MQSASRFIQEAGSPHDEDGQLNPYLMTRDGDVRTLSPLVTTPGLFE